MEQLYKKCMMLILSLLMISMMSNNIYANKYYVTKTGSNSDGLSWATGYNDLQTALAAVADGDTIVVASGTYIPDVSSRSIAFKIVAGVKVFGGFEGTEDITAETIDSRDFKTNETILSGDLLGNDVSLLIADNSYTVVIFDAWDAAMSNTTVLDGFTISGGYANGTVGESIWGGGIYMNQGYEKDCSPLLKNLIVKNNKARSGGGIYLAGIGGSNAKISPTIDNIIFENNDAYYLTGSGGAIYMASAPGSDVEATITNAVFINNSAGATAGGVYLLGGTVGNPGNVSATISNATFYGNSCGSIYGSAFYSNGQEGISDPVLNNVIFYGNGETQVHSFATPSSSGISNPTYNNCLITGSPSTNWNSLLGTDLGGNIEGDPLLADPENGNVDIIEGSPVLNTGDNTYGLNIGYYQGTGITMPTINIVSDFTDFGTIEVGNLSDEQAFSISGSDLLNTVIISLPEGFEASLSSGVGFFNPLNLFNNGSIATTSIYVRFKPSITGDHSGSMSINSAGASEQLFAITAYAGGSPEISTIDNHSVCSHDNLNLAFTVTDDDLSTLSFDIIISNETILPPENIVLSGSSGTYNLAIASINEGIVDITVQVTDGNLNETSTGFTLTNISGPTLSVDFLNRICNGDPAELMLSSSGGSGLVNYKLNDGGYSLQTYYSYLSDGDHVVIAQDEAGCTDTSEVYTVGNPSYITGIGDVSKPITCQGDNDATISVKASGGWGGFEYSLDEINYQSDTAFKNLSPGNYLVYVRDQGGCTENIFGTNIIDPEQLVIDYITISDEFESVNKIVNIVAYGGWYPLTYALNDGVYQSESYFNNIIVGEYTAYVKDDNGCIVSDAVNVTTGINNNISKISFVIYPNPASDYIYVDASQLSEKIEKIEIYDLAGHKKSIHNMDTVFSGKIDISDFNQGVYILLLRLQDGKTAYKKIIIH